MITSRVAKPTTESLRCCVSGGNGCQVVGSSWGSMRLLDHISVFGHFCQKVSLGQETRKTDGSHALMKRMEMVYGIWHGNNSVTTRPKKYHLIQQPATPHRHPSQAPWSWEPYRYMAWAMELRRQWTIMTWKIVAIDVDFNKPCWDVVNVIQHLDIVTGESKKTKSMEVQTALQCTAPVVRSWRLQEQLSKRIA